MEDKRPISSSMIETFKKAEKVFTSEATQTKLEL